MYNFDVQRFGKQMLPPILRGKVILAIVRVLLTPIAYVMGLFTRLRTDSLDKLGRSGLVATLVEVLNKRFALIDEIWLEDIAPKEVYLYHEREGQEAIHLHRPTSAEPATILRYSDEGTHEPDFIVHAPSYLADQDAELRRIIDYYRPAGRKYIIQYYDYNG